MKRSHYSHILAEERDRISYYRSQALSIREIAERLGRSPSSISREIQRNQSAVFELYLGHAAQMRTERRLSKAHIRPRLKSPLVRSYVKCKLECGWSPEQIAGRLPIDHPGKSISTEAIYQYVYDPAVRVQCDLVPFLARRHKKRQSKGHRKTHKSSHIRNRIDIIRRPEHIGNRKQFGHWESDAAISRQSIAAVNVTCERKSRYTVITKMKRKSAPQTVRSVSKALKDLPGKARRTLTYDNGSENVDHDTINDRLCTRSYFCQPYHSWEKGTVENTIGLMRRVFPKKTDFANVSQRQLTSFQRRLNNRPRKCLFFKTPNEVFRKCCT